MAADEKWYFTKEQLDNTPSRKCGYEPFKELSYRQQAANFIQDLGQKLKVSQLCINTAIVYMHRFYVFHSFSHFPWQSIAAAAVFLAAKVEEQPRKLEHVIFAMHRCKNPDANIDVNSERYQAQSQDLVFNENILLQTLGFDVAIDHPHTHVVRCCHLVRASKDLAQTSYFMASYSLHLTTMCLQYKPTVVACFCIHLACKWSNWEIPLSNEKKEWFTYVDSTVTAELLKQLTTEFLVIFDNSPSRLKDKIMALGGSGFMQYSSNHGASPFENEPKKLIPPPDQKDHTHRFHHVETKPGPVDDKHRSVRPHEASSSSQMYKEREYREKKERERLAQYSKTSAVPPPHTHHRPPVDPKAKQYSRPLTGVGFPHSTRPGESHRETSTREHRDPNRDLIRESMREMPSREPSEQSSAGQEVHKRDYQVKSGGSDANVSNTSSANKHIDASRSRPSDPNKIPPNPMWRHEEMIKNLPKLETDSSKHDAYASKPHDTAKSVLKPLKPPQHNGNNSFNLPETSKIEMKEEEAPLPKKPSLFSPEKSPPKKTPSPTKTPNFSGKRPTDCNISTNIPPVRAEQPKRTRVSSTGSEPELRPVMKKIDQIEGFENLMRESSIGLKMHQVPDIITPISDIKTEIEEPPLSKELKPPDIIPPFNSQAPLANGIETNPILISNLLKEAPPICHLPTIKTSPVEISNDNKEHHHKSKKKNKEKHKHKDKEKSREEREKKKKHKDKEREKHKKEKLEYDPPVAAQPIKIKISKDKIQPPENSVSGLKIKIPKDRIKTETIGEASVTATATATAQTTPGGSLKIKISKDVINSFSNDNKKREREKSPNSAGPNKMSKSNYTKLNGRNSYTKVAQMGDGDSSVHRLADSKYINKGSRKLSQSPPFFASRDNLG